MDASCQCGAVTFKTPTDKPLEICICHCTECQKLSNSGFSFSAMFPRFDPPDNPKVSKWTRKTDGGGTLVCYFCSVCGTRLMHNLVGGNTTSVKGGALDDRHELDWAGAPHIWTKSAILPIPKGSMTYPGEPPAES